MKVMTPLEIIADASRKYRPRGGAAGEFDDLHQLRAEAIFEALKAVGYTIVPIKELS